MKTLALSFAACAAILLPTSTAFATLAFDNPTLESVSGTGTVSGSGTDVTFDWDDTPFAAYIEFSITTPSTLSLASFTVLIPVGGDTSDVTGYTLDEIDAFAGAVVGSRLTDQTNFASSAPGLVNGDTNLFGIPGATNTNPVANAGDVLFANLDAGFYRLGVYDSGTPQSATATFSIAAIPEPSAFLFGSLVTGGVGFVAYRRRRTLAAA